MVFVVAVAAAAAVADMVVVAMTLARLSMLKVRLLLYDLFL